MLKTRDNKNRKNKTKKREKGLYKQSPLLNKVMLKVSKLHTIVYYLYGNKNGKPVLYVHGGPGAGSERNMSRFFNPKKYFIILVDQRGCGNSIPFGEIRENTTNDLIEDFEKIRKQLDIKKWMLFGGSWGSTLSLAYSMKHPEVVTELVLRGIFLMRQKEIDWVNEHGASNIFPKEWEDYLKPIPLKERNHLMKAYGKRLYGNMGKAEQKKASLAWSIWEASISHLYPESHEKVVKDLTKTSTYIPISIIEHHYFSHKGFFPRDGYLLEDTNINKIKHIPTFVVQGQYDMVCPITSAYDLHKKLPKSKLYVTMAGHSGFEKENIKKLVEITSSLINNASHTLH